MNKTTNMVANILNNTAKEESRALGVCVKNAMTILGLSQAEVEAHIVTANRLGLVKLSRSDLGTAPSYTLRYLTAEWHYVNV